MEIKNVKVESLNIGPLPEPWEGTGVFPVTVTKEQEQPPTKRRASYLLISDFALLDDWAQNIYDMFQSHPYLVGSSLDKPDYRDVDVRLILFDEEFDALFPGYVDDAHPTPRLRWMNVALSIWAQKVTGLPVDFQVQRMTEANELYGGRRRNALGLRVTKRSAGMVFMDRLEYLAEEDPGFRAWLQEGIDQLNDGYSYETLVMGDDGQLHVEQKQPAKDQGNDDR